VNIVITGLPGSGKSTLAAGLRRVTGWTLISLDALKESLAAAWLSSGTLPMTNAQLDLAVARQAADLVPEASPCILEGFIADERMRRAVQGLWNDAVEVFCDCPIDVAWARFAARAARRSPPHPDAAITQEQYVRDVTRVDGHKPLDQTPRRMSVSTDREVQADQLFEIACFAGWSAATPRA